MKSFGSSYSKVGIATGLSICFGASVMTLGFDRFFGGDLVWISSVDVGLVITKSLVVVVLSTSCEIRSGLILVGSIVPLSRFYLIRSRAAEWPSFVLPLFDSNYSSGLMSSPSSSSRSRSIARLIRLRGLAGAFNFLSS